MLILTILTLYSMLCLFQTHRRQHTGERPYSCTECQHHFTNWPNYNKHMKRRHGINTSQQSHPLPTQPSQQQQQEAQQNLQALQQQVQAVQVQTTSGAQQTGLTPVQVTATTVQVRRTFHSFLGRGGVLMISNVHLFGSRSCRCETH